MCLSLKREKYPNKFFLSNFKFTKIPIVQSLVIILIHKVWSWSWNWQCNGHFSIWALKTWFQANFTLFTILSVWAAILTFEYLLSYFLGPLGSVVPPSGHKTWILSTFLEGKAVFWKKLIFTKSEKNIFAPIGKWTLKVFLGQPNIEL